MKKLIRRWLEIEPVNADTLVSKKELRSEVAAAVSEVLNGSGPSYSLFLGSTRTKLISGIHKVAEDFLLEEAGTLVKKRLDELVEPEAFIDEIVKRIQRKQL